MMILSAWNDTGYYADYVTYLFNTLLSTLNEKQETVNTCVIAVDDIIVNNGFVRAGTV